MKGRLSRYIALCLAVAWTGCANIVPPSGGAKDEAPPKLRSVSPPDSQRNARVSKIELRFDEYITLGEPDKEIQISPLLSIPLNVTAQNKRITIAIPDSLLLDETTYRITFGSAIRDLHEANPYQSKGYTFTTGSYFDSLTLSGTVHDAHTGLPDTAAFVMLYDAAENDSAIVRHKPLFVTRTTPFGTFQLQGLPPRAFRIYALRDGNNNLTFDGGPEWIAFIDSTVRPSAGTAPGIALRTFPEPAGDTGAVKAKGGRLGFGGRGEPAFAADIAPGGYRVGADTGDARKRTYDITQPLTITFGRRLRGEVSAAKIFLSSDSAGVLVESAVRISHDSAGLQYRLATDWREDAVYTLRLQKGFAQDSAGADLLPGRYTFRTRRDEDYGKLRIHLPSIYFGRGHILQVANERDTVYQQAVKDTMINLPRIAPGTYTIRVIEDANENGRWDAGDLFLRRQPEVVVPYNNSINLKAGWEQQIDFTEPRKRRPEADRR